MATIAHHNYKARPDPSTGRAGMRGKRSRQFRQTGPGRELGCSASQAGLTLLELLVTLVLIAIILGLGSPSFRDFQRNSRLTAVANDFLSTLQLARTEAVKRQKPVSICPSANAGAEAPICSAQPDFSGWIVFEDSNGTCRPDSGATLIRAQADITPADGAQISARASGECVSFAETGYVRTLPGFATADRLLVCDQRGMALSGDATRSTARGVTLSPTGRAWITRDTPTIQSWALPCPASGQ